MEHAPLRPVPARPAGPIDPATAAREVAAWLPTLPADTARAFALVALAERPRSEVAPLLAVSEDELAGALAAARKELRRTLASLPGSGWCERAERLVSDRLDGPLADRDAHRLDAHLRNCTRCVEHERRLVQATDALVLSLGGAPSRGPVPEAPTKLREAPSADAPPGEAASAAAPPPDDARTEETPPAEAAPGDAGAPRPTDEQIAAAAEVLVAVRTRAQIATALVWNAMVVLAVLLAVATIALTVAGILGTEL